MNVRVALLAGRSALLVLGITSGTRAVDGWNLEWTAPTECPRASEVRRAIGEHLPGGFAEVNGRVVIEASTRGYRAHLTLGGDAGGTRELEAESCRSVTRAVALIIAISVDRSAAVALSERLTFEEDDEGDGRRSEADEAHGTGPTPPRVDPAHVLDQEATEASGPPREPARSVAFQLSGGGGVEVGWIPGVAPTFGLQAELVFPWVRLALEGAFSLERRLAGPGGTTVFVDAPSLGARVCRGLWSEGPLFVCGRARAAFVSAVATPSVTEERATVVAWLLEPGVLVELPLGAGWSIAGTGFFTFPARSHPFVVLAGDGVTELPAFRLDLGGSASLSLAHRFE